MIADLEKSKRWPRIKRGLMIGGGVLLALGVVVSFLPEPVAVDMATVETGRVELAIHGEGKTRVRENYVISAPISGRLLRIDSEPGDLVTIGETVIATMEPADPTLLDVRSEAQAQATVKAAEAARELASAQLSRKRAELDFAEKELVRGRELAEKGTISERVLDQRELDVKTLQAEVATARSNLRKAESELELARAALIRPAGAGSGDNCCIEVPSPVSGRVLRLLHKSEGVVAAGEPLVEVGDLTDLELVIDLLSVDAVKVEPGDVAWIDHWGGPYRLEARVRLVEPSGYTKISALGIEEQRVNVILDLVEPPARWQNLGDGFRVEAFIVVDAREDVTVAPTSALFRSGETWAVFRVEDGDAVLTPVAVGLRNDTHAEILEGLSPGDTVVTHPPNKLSDRASVITRGGDGQN